MLASRLQRDGSAEGSGDAVIVRVAIQVVAVPGAAEAAAIAGHVLQHLGDVLCRLIGVVDLGIRVGSKTLWIQGDRTRSFRRRRQDHAVLERRREWLSGLLRLLGWK